MNGINIETAGLSLTNPEKTKCGDSFSIRNEEGKGTLLIVADGVSSCPKDWLASKTVCEVLPNRLFSSQDGLSDETMANCIQETSDILYRGFDGTMGMQSTLLLAFLNPSRRQIRIASVGDSRIYGFKKEMLTQLTTDEKTTEVVRENGKIKTFGGIPVTRSLLIRSIGIEYLGEIIISRIDFDDHSGIVLGTDGFFELPGFEEFTNKAINAEDAQEYLDQAKQEIVEKIEDDATLVIARWYPDPAAIEIEKVVKSESGLPLNLELFQARKFLFELLDKSLESGDDSLTGACIHFISQYQLFAKKPVMISILEKLIKHKSPYVQEFTTIIRKL